MKRLCSIIAFAACSAVALAGQASIRWPDGKRAAISLSFDDARLSQIDTGLALLHKHGVKATFFVSPGSLEKRLDGWKKAAASGHEIGNHSRSHPCTGNYAFSLKNALEGYTLAGMAEDIDGASADIQRLLGVKPATFAYPCGQKFVGRGTEVKSYVPLVAERFIVGRGYLDEAANDPLVCDLAQATGMSFDDLSYEQMMKLVSQAAGEGRWLILVGHEIGKRAFQTTDASALEALCEYAKDPANGLWIDTVEAIGKYIRDQRAANPAAKARGYSIPVVDIAGETDRQTVVDREPGQYLGHPSTVLLEDGKTMICVYPKGHGRGAIVMKRSKDGGRTWSNRLPVPENWATSRETPTIHRVVDPRAVKRLILFSGLYPIRMAVSEDDGATWTPLKPIGDFGGVVTMASVERLKDGRYMALFHDDGRFIDGSGRPSTFKVYKTISNDGGLTWSKPEVIAGLPTAHLCEPGLVRSPDGKQLAVLLRENSRKRNSFVIFSDDEGSTWTEPVELPGALTGDRHTARYAPDGRLFITFRDTTLESPTKGDWVGWVGVYDDIVHGREGQYRVRLMDNHKGADCCYPGLELLPDGAFVTTTYGHWIEGEPPFVASVRFKLEELDARLNRGR